MTVSELHRSFRFGLDKMDGLNYPNFLPEEIDLLLNQAQDRFVKQRYGSTNPKRTGFEQEQKRTEDLKNIIKEIIATIPVERNNDIAHKGYQITPQSDHWFIVYERAIVNYTGCNQAITYHSYTPADGIFAEQHNYNATLSGVYADVIPTTHLELNSVLKDPFKGPTLSPEPVILRIELDGKIELIIPAGCTGLFYIYRYIRKPVRISLSGGVTCELSDHTHQEIIDEAIKIALEGIEAKRTQTFTPIVDNNKE